MAKNDKQVKKNKDDSLTLPQETFVQELIKGLTQRKAYLVAYPNRSHWKDKTIDEEACKLLKKPKINTRYYELKQRLIKEAEEECIIDAKEILKEYKKIAFSDIKDYLSFKTMKTMIDVNGVKIPDFAQVIQMKDSEEVDGAVIQEVSINQSGTFSFKLYNKIKALDKLFEHVNKGDGEGKEVKDDGLTKQIEKIANSDIWEDFEDDTTDE